VEVDEARSFVTVNSTSQKGQLMLVL